MTDTIANESLIQLTPAATGQVRVLLAQNENAGKSLRIYVEQGGCSGMQYGMTFDERRDGDFVAEHDGVTTLVDAFSAQYLRGTVADFNDALTGGGFKIPIPTRNKAVAAANPLRPERT